MKVVNLRWIVVAVCTSGVLHWPGGSLPMGGAAEWAVPGGSPEQPMKGIDRYGDPLPAGAIARIGTTRFRPGVFIATVAYSPDGKTIVSGGSDQFIHFWETTTGKELRSIRAPGYIDHVAFSPDSRVLASSSMGKVYLWDTATGKEIRSWKHDGRVLAFSPDGATLASAGSSICLWDVATGKEQLKWQSKSSINWVAFVPDGKTLVSRAWDQTVRTWEAATGQVILEWKTESPSGAGTGFDMSRDGKLLASPGKDGLLCLYDVATGKRVAAWESKNAGGAVALSADGKFLASAEDSVIRVRDVATGKIVCACPRARSYFPAITFAPDGKSVAAGEAGCMIRRWQVPTGQEIDTPGTDAPVVYSAAFLPGTRTLVTAGTDYKFRFWDGGTGQEVRNWDAETTEFTRFVVSADARLLAGRGDDRTIRVWDVPTGKEIHLWNDHANALAMSADGKTLVSASLDRPVNRPIKDSIVRLRDLATGKELRAWSVSSYHISSLAMSPDGRSLVSSGYEPFTASPGFRSIRLWDMATGKEFVTSRYQKAGANVFRVGLSADGSFLASIEGPNVRLYEAITGQELRAWKLDAGSIAFSPDGRFLAVGGRDAHVFDLETGNGVWTGQGHRSSIWMLDFSFDGEILATVSQDTTTLLWDVSSWTRKKPLQPSDLSGEQLAGLWAELAGDDARKAYQAACRLARSGKQTVPFLHEALQPVARVNAKRLEQLLADLESDNFQVRNRASEELEKLGELAEPSLRKALAAQPALEMQRRLDKLLETPPSFQVPTRDRLRFLRSIIVLERIASPEARKVLQTLAEGAAEARLTSEAQAALGRIGKRP